MLDFELSEEQKLIQKSVDEIFKKLGSKVDELREISIKQKKFPEELWEEFTKAGLLGSIIPEKYGGTDLGLLGLTVAMEQVGTYGFGNAILILTVMDSCCILRNGTEELKKRFLPKIAEGKLKIVFALTEPDAGSNTFRIKTFARKEGNVYKLRGEKIFITGVDMADYILVVARTKTIEQVEKEGLPKAFGLSLFLVDSKAEGLDKKEIPMKSIEGTTQWSLFFDDVEVPVENLVGQENMGSMALFNSLNPERILAAATCIGVSEFMLKKSVDYAKQRKVFKNTPIGNYQAIQHPLAEIKIEQEAARLVMYKAAWAFDKNLPPGVIGMYADMAKYLAAEVAIKAVDRAIETYGGYGFSEEYKIIDYWEGMRLIRTAPITKEMILNYISEHVLGLPKSY